MSRTCTVCSHPDRDAIDAALVSNEPYRHIAARTGTSTTALQRHRDGHIPVALAEATQARAILAGDDLLDRLTSYESRIARVLDEVEAKKQFGLFFAGMREARACLALLAELKGELDRRPTVNLHLSPEWHQVRADVLDTLRDYPDARLAVAARLSQLDVGQ